MTEKQAKKESTPGEAALGLGIIALIAGLAIWGFTSCESTPEDPAKAMRHEADLSVYTCQSALEKVLKDPGSAEFSSSRVIDQDAIGKDSTGWKVEGLVNAKNSFGGYVGNEAWTCDVTVTHDGELSHTASARLLDLRKVLEDSLGGG